MATPGTHISDLAVKKITVQYQARNGRWLAKNTTQPITTNVNYRVRVDFGNKIRINAGSDNFKENLDFRLVFMGWKLGSRHMQKSQMQFYTNASFNRRASNATRHHEYINTKYHPHHADLSFWAYFRVRSNVNMPARLMRFDCGMYASVRQNRWQKVTVS